MLHVLRVIVIAIHLVGLCYVCVMCHVNGAYISAPSSVYCSFRVGKQAMS